MSEHTPFRILVIANESIDGSELRALLPDGSDVLVVAPALARACASGCPTSILRGAGPNGGSISHSRACRAAASR